ncbi:hypothetical protein [Paenibacillus glycanilyticus]|uniref:Uncharacterized protein n=1 Tax=Paenibacillus glycanilyticus TaxID=126569 RepID=A0ABQ6G805_9BACL|nr:hypothetical protein [Paenibacillus glycanilyticus]GLX67096.1 hypothetical protein MU1_14400 [Paenibacillus glycanilyticus]
MSTITQTEREVKLELLSSLARSQTALARILDSIADVSGASPALAQSIAENVELLTTMQKYIAESVTGLTMRRKYRKLGSPGTPWLNATISGLRRKRPRKGGV